MRDGKPYDPTHPYDNRDYRFYANILYDGCIFRDHEMEIHYNKEGKEEIAGADLTPYGTSANAAVSKTGYYLGKLMRVNRIILSGALQRFCWIMQKLIFCRIVLMMRWIK